MPTAKELMATAVADTGLDDFGDDAFRDGLEVLVGALRDQARLNARGEGYLYPRVVEFLSQRLRVEDWYRRHPEIDEVPIEPPLI
ncbi:MAG: sulfotransferase, partial [Nocardia sp.]|nr:sulfotransferase [Nocardia sp.]